MKPTSRRPWRSRASRVAVVNPRQVRDFAKAIGRLAKTDATRCGRARALCRGGAARAAPAARCRPSGPHGPRGPAAATRRDADRRAQPAAAGARAASSRDVQVHIHFPGATAQGYRLTTCSTTMRKPVPLWRAREQLLRSVPGIGPTTAASSCWPTSPELGRLTRQQIAALVGVAPLNRDSGTPPGPRLLGAAAPTVRATSLHGHPRRHPPQSRHRRLLSPAPRRRERPRSPSSPPCTNSSPSSMPS